MLLAAGLITMVLGTLVGLPALRMSGLYLALITLMLAGAITVALATINFPNGGHGFTGYNGSSVHIPAIRRPSIAGTDPAFFRYSVVVGILMFLLVLAHIRGRPGRAWAAIRQSESAALAAGINTTLTNSGRSHWLRSSPASPEPRGRQFPLSELADVQDPGFDHAAGRCADGRRVQHLGRDRGRLPAEVPTALLNNWGVSPDWLTILFGIGVLQVLTTAPRDSSTRCRGPARGWDDCCAALFRRRRPRG